MKDKKLTQLRTRIDALDERIVGLLVRRAGLADEIGKMKKEGGAPVKDAEREARLLRRVRSLTRKPLSKSAVEGIYGVILRESRCLQSRRARKRK